MAKANPTRTSCIEKDISRRGLLAALPLAGSALALPFPAVASSGDDETPMKAAFRQWKAHLDSMARMDDEEEFDAAHDRLLEIDDRMRTLPCLTAADVLILLTAQTRWGESCCHEWKEHLPADALAVVERSLGG